MNEDDDMAGYPVKKYNVTGWIQSTESIDQMVWAENEAEAYDLVYFKYVNVNNHELEVEEIKGDLA